MINFKLSFKFWITSTEDGETYSVWEDAPTLEKAWEQVRERFRDGAVDIAYAEHAKTGHP